MKYWPVALLLLLTQYASAQQAQDPFYFVKECSTFELTGKEIEIEIRVKSMPQNDSSRIRIYAIQLGKGKEEFLSHTLSYAETEEGLWRRYFVRMRVDQFARKIWFYCGVSGVGTYYFDQLQVMVKESNEVMRILDEESDDFERKQILKSYIFPHELPKHIRFMSSRKIKFEGKQSLQIKLTTPL